MRITTSSRYHRFDSCDVQDCQKHYCNEHRLLWRDCDTAKDDKDGAGQHWWALGDCPDCERQARGVRYAHA